MGLTQMMCDATLGSIGGPVIVPKKLGKYLEKLSLLFHLKRKLVKLLCTTSGVIQKFFPDFIVCVF